VPKDLCEFLEILADGFIFPSYIGRVTFVVEGVRTILCRFLKAIVW